MHNLCKVDGVMMRSNPSDEYGGGAPSKHHGLFHYTPSFYSKLARICGYKILDIREMTQRYWPGFIPGRKNFTYVTMIKSKNNNFADRKLFSTIEGELGRYGK